MATTEYSWEKMLWDQIFLVYYELLSEAITGALYRTKLMIFSRAPKEKLAHYHCRHVAVKIYLETFSYKVPHHLLYSTDTFTSYEETKNEVESWMVLKDEASFRLGIHMLPESGKK